MNKAHFILSRDDRPLLECECSADILSLVENYINRHQWDDLKDLIWHLIDLYDVTVNVKRRKR